jgi:hypothetical protein
VLEPRPDAPMGVKAASVDLPQQVSTRLDATRCGPARATSSLQHACSPASIRGSGAMKSVKVASDAESTVTHASAQERSMEWVLPAFGAKALPAGCLREVCDVPTRTFTVHRVAGPDADAACAGADGSQQRGGAGVDAGGPGLLLEQGRRGQPTQWDFCCFPNRVRSSSLACSRILSCSAGRFLLERLM